MPASEARIRANRANAARSTGPKTSEGKECSRANGLKHGMAGRGVVIPDEDVDEVERRGDALRAELAPRSTLGAILVGQMAMLSVRMDRAARQEFAGVALRVRHAEDDFDEARIASADALWGAIGDDPRGNLRRLLKSPEGVDVLIRTWEELRAGLTREGKPLWTAAHLVTAAHLSGLGEPEARGSRVGVLSRAIWGDFDPLGDEGGAGLEEDARRAWARGRMVEEIDDRVAGLRALVETFDFDAIGQDRAESGARALFDPSKEATLARRYESEASRRFFRALEEFRRAESEYVSEPETAGRSTPAPPPAERATRPPAPPLASSRDEPSARPAGRDPAPRGDASTSLEIEYPPDSRRAEVVRGPDGQPVRAYRPIPGAT